MSTTVAGATNPKRSIALKLTVIARQLRQNFDHSIEGSDLTRAKWSLIAAVARNPGATQHAIANALEVREITAGRLIDRLCEAGYLERRPKPNDRRAYCVFLTARAQPMLEKLEELARLHESEIFAGLNEQDLETLDTLLDSVAHDLAVARTAGTAAK
jgi:MarR family transcriptional regulator for hemolysin